jgi:hypothetical protein
MYNKMNVEKKILEELKRFNQINAYILKEQPEVPTEPEGDVPPVPEAPTGGDVPPAPDAATPAPEAPAADAGAAPTEVPEPVDVENDPDVEEVDAEKPEDEETEEIDITDLVTSQQEIQAKQDEFMNDMFSKIDDLASKLENMDQIMTKINDLETKFDKYREKTPEEKLMLRSLDSYPYNQKLTDFFQDKEEEMEKTGKNEYVLTSDEVENFSPNEVKKTFNIYDDENPNM